MSKRQANKGSGRTIWCDRGWMPIYYGFAPNAKEWAKQVKKLGFDLTEAPYPESDGRCTWFTKGNKTSCLVTIHERMDGESGTCIAGIMAHEAMHVFQKLRDHIGETDRIGAEFEAYNLHYIYQNLLEAYVKSRNPTLFRK